MTTAISAPKKRSPSSAVDAGLLGYGPSFDLMRKEQTKDTAKRAGCSAGASEVDLRPEA
jgi:hypothetical protein